MMIARLKIADGHGEWVEEYRVPSYATLSEVERLSRALIMEYNHKAMEVHHHRRLENVEIYDSTHLHFGSLDVLPGYPTDFVEESIEEAVEDAIEEEIEVEEEVSEDDWWEDDRDGDDDDWGDGDDDWSDEW